MHASSSPARSTVHALVLRLYAFAVQQSVEVVPLESIARPTEPEREARSRMCGLTADLNGIPARICEITERTARVELSSPILLDEVTLTFVRDGASQARAARVVSYRRHADGPASYGLEFVAP